MTAPEAEEKHIEQNVRQVIAIVTKGARQQSPDLSRKYF
jgi:hypothetical protein